ncbi:Arylsulfatase A [Zhouia amylolytica]|uniref:Arylsulfatase A n=1 Tax=Zhouia amylolytica TaxID=376730 RepID=A0A1I6PMU4_9FLAO|nr:arylsulfatase [Zhouia amylolytica]SFS41547.1 Arylsulfatase A [Zhouia amylolytica]
MRVLIAFVSCVLLVFVSCVKNEKKENKRPNIILIYADDLGIGLLGHEGQEIIKTPNIDRLASEGIRFTNAYSNMLCAPARASLITGLHDCHKNGFQVTGGGAYKYVHTEKASLEEVDKRLNEALDPIPENQVFLGQVAKESGYKTAQFGKLEWGFSATDHQMKRHGWDYYLGYLDHVRAHGFYPPFLFENGAIKMYEGNTLINAGKTGEPETEAIYKERWNMEGKEVYSQDIFMEGILSFLESNSDQPFFLYFPTQLPHGPVAIPEVHADFINDDRLTPIEKEYASMVKLLDDNVGQIMDKLVDLGIDDNTLIIFTADNGHEIYYAQEGRVTKPYSNIKTGERFDDLGRKYYSDLAGDIFDGNGGRAGMKRSNLQGGINVPLIMRWPDKINENITSDRLIASYDLLPTIAEIVGYNKPIEVDGVSYFKEIFGDDNVEEHEYVVYSSFTGPTLITKDGWKIRTHLRKNAFELFYLPEDFKEEKDLSEQYPEKFKALKEMMLLACDGDFKNGLYGG